MLIEFTVGNYLSFKDKKTLSLEATSIKENPENVFKVGKYNLLRSAVLYGANSSGKSNFIKAMGTMKEMVLTSALYNSISEINVTPFLLNIETELQPSYFEILILIKGVRYRYGFEANRKMIISEWLFERKVNSEKLLFIRDKDKIEVSDEFEEGDGIEEKTRENALFLSVVDQFNGTVSKSIMNWFSGFGFLSGLNHDKENGLTFSFVDFESLTHYIKEFLT